MSGELLADPEIRRMFEEELLFGEATDTLSALVHSLGLSQKELATRLGVSEGRVSQILSGAENLTLRSLAAVGWALGVRFGFEPIPMADRAGTPACDDPEPPSWLHALGPKAVIEFRAVDRPPPKEAPVARHFKLIEGGKELAA